MTLTWLDEQIQEAQNKFVYHMARARRAQRDARAHGAEMEQARYWEGRKSALLDARATLIGGAQTLRLAVV